MPRRRSSVRTRKPAICRNPAAPPDFPHKARNRGARELPALPPRPNDREEAALAAVLRCRRRGRRHDELLLVLRREHLARAMHRHALAARWPGPPRKPSAAVSLSAESTVALSWYRHGHRRPAAAALARADPWTSGRRLGRGATRTVRRASCAARWNVVCAGVAPDGARGRLCQLRVFPTSSPGASAASERRRWKRPTTSPRRSRKARRSRPSTARSR